MPQKLNKRSVTAVTFLILLCIPIGIILHPQTFCSGFSAIQKKSLYRIKTNERFKRQRYNLPLRKFFPQAGKTTRRPACAFTLDLHCYLNRFHTVSAGRLACLVCWYKQRHEMETRSTKSALGPIPQHCLTVSKFACLLQQTNLLKGSGHYW